MGKDNYIVSAFTGIAVVNLKYKSKTLNNLFSLGAFITNKPPSTNQLLKVRLTFESCKFLIIDEISMVSSELLLKIEFLLLGQLNSLD